jgi:hypothetical protein
VPRGFVDEIIATVDVEDGYLQDILRMHPSWADLTLATDVGLGLTNATNRGFDVESDGPFTVFVEAVGNTAGSTTADPPLPLSDLSIEVTSSGADLPTDTLRTDADGRGSFVVAPVAAVASSHRVEVRAGGEGNSVGVFTAFHRALPAMRLTFPTQMPGGQRAPILVESVSDDGDPMPGLFVELVATGGTVQRDEGNTTLSTYARLDEGSDQITIDARLSLFPGGPVVDTAFASAVRGQAGVPYLTGRRDVAAVIGDGYINSCLPGQAGGCPDPGYGLREYAAAGVLESASISQDIVGDDLTGIESASGTATWSGGVGTADIAFRFVAGGNALAAQFEMACTGAGSIYVFRIAGGGFDWIPIAHQTAYRTDETGADDALGDDVAQAYGGETLVFDLYALQGTPYQVFVYGGGGTGGTCTYEARFGEDAEGE